MRGQVKDRNSSSVCRYCSALTFVNSSRQSRTPQTSADHGTLHWRPDMSTKKALLGRTAIIASLTALAIGALTPTSADARNGRWHRGGGGAAVGAALAAGAIGTGLAIAAS